MSALTDLDDLGETLKAALREADGNLRQRLTELLDVREKPLGPGNYWAPDAPVHASVLRALLAADLNDLKGL